MARVRKRTWRTKTGELKTAWTVNVEEKGSRERKQFASKREADEYRITIEQQFQKGTFRAEGTKTSIKDLASLFLTYCEGRMQRGERMTRHNLKVYRGHIDNYICAATPATPPARKTRVRPFTKGVGEFKVRQLTARHVAEFRDRLRDAGVSISTTRKILGTLQLVLGHAVSLDLAAVNVARGIKVIGRRDEGARRIVPPSKEDLQRLLAAADADFRVMLIFASASGLRAGELHALRWKHIDWKRGEVTVETRVDAYRQEDVTKSVAGMRTVPIGDAILALLKDWKTRVSGSGPADLIFPNKAGGYEAHDNMVKRRFLPLFRKLTEWHEQDPAHHPAPPARFNWHALRHFAVSCWIEAGLSPKTVQVFAGHSSLQITMDRYGHLFKNEDHKRPMNALASQLMGDR